MSGGLYGLGLAKARRQADANLRAIDEDWERPLLRIQLRNSAETIERLCAEVERLQERDRRHQRVLAASRALVRAVNAGDATVAS